MMGLELGKQIYPEDIPRFPWCFDLPIFVSLFATLSYPIHLYPKLSKYSKRKVSGSSSPTNSGATLCVGQESAAPLFLAHGEFAKTS